MKARPDPTKERELQTKAVLALKSLEQFYEEHAWNSSRHIVHQAIAKLEFLKQL